MEPEEIYAFILANIDDAGELNVFLSNTNLNVQNNEGNTVLHLAIKQDNIRVVKILLGSPTVDVNIPNHENDTPLELSGDEATGEIFRLLLKRPDLEVQLKPIYIFENAFIGGHEDIVNTLLQHPRFDINHVYTNKTTPLVFVIWKGIEPSLFIKFLSLPNLDLNKQNDVGNTALHFAAVSKDRIRYLEILLSQPTIEIDAVNNEGDTPLSFAVHNTNRKAVNLLLFRKADKSIVDHKGRNVIELTTDTKIINSLIGIQH